MRGARKKTMLNIDSGLLFAAAVVVGVASFITGALGLLWPMRTLLVGAVYFGIRSAKV